MLMFSPITIAPMAIVQTAPTASADQAVAVVPTPWYRTPIGIIAILATAFVGYKYLTRKPRTS